MYFVSNFKYVTYLIFFICFISNRVYKNYITNKVKTLKLFKQNENSNSPQFCYLL